MKLFSRGDGEGFVVAFVNNLVQLLILAPLCTGVLGFSPALIYGRILPGVAISFLVGNIFYAWQAVQLARRRVWPGRRTIIDAGDPAWRHHLLEQRGIQAPMHPPHERAIKARQLSDPGSQPIGCRGVTFAAQDVGDAVERNVAGVSRLGTFGTCAARILDRACRAAKTRGQRSSKMLGCVSFRMIYFPIGSAADGRRAAVPQ